MLKKPTMKHLVILTTVLFCMFADLKSQVAITINAMDAAKSISPYIYGKNNSISDNSFGTYDPMTEAEWQYLRDLGIHMFRENGGNNATKYNWRRKLSSHPDWYNNVYSHDWDYAASTLGNNIPAAQGMWAFQLAGKAAKTPGYNFDDWSYNRSNWWSGCGQNLAGNGVMNTSGGSDAQVDGNPDLYLENWNADSTTGILDHWFGAGGVGLDKNKIIYWSMDNEPEIWNGTHDDIWPTQPTAEAFMQQYFAVAKKAREKFPDIKLIGPVPANEWQWYNWNGNKISYHGKEYTWLEYFILRIAEEQQASGIRLLDVLDIHFYPGDTIPENITQLHRVFFDTTYVYPGANGVKRSGPGGWDNSLNREYIFKRCNDWLTKYMGADHGVTFSVSETSLAKRNNPSLTAVWYASTLGEFARHGVEIFTPWDWPIGMSEVVHLFTHYGKNTIVPSISSDENYVSAYPTRNQANDSLVVFLVNRHVNQSQTVNLQINDFYIGDGYYKTLKLSGLPSTETFVSQNDNALIQNTVAVSQNKAELNLDPLSVTALILTANPVEGPQWRSSLYPENWKPGYKDAQGRFLHDFSYAGYHMGEKPLPAIDDRIIDVTQAPYNADNSGTVDATSAIQLALNNAGQSGGGVVYLPAGTYKVSAPESASFALKIGHDSTILRGAGKDLTFIKNVSVNMRQKDIISVYGNSGYWFYAKNPTSKIVVDLLEPTRIIPVESVSGFKTGDNVIITCSLTNAFIAEHNMTGNWTSTSIKGVAFMRTIKAIDQKNNLLIVDEPTKYALKTRDFALVYLIEKQISECGIEDLSIGNIENPGTGWDEESYNDSSTGAWEVHYSQAVHFKNSMNCWMKNVGTFKPAENIHDYHLLSNGVRLNQCRFITIDSCSFNKSQYEGGGGNGYMYTLESNDCLIKNSSANHGRHNYDLKQNYSNGNVILNCRGENSKYASDFHMFLSMSNLFDACTFNRDFLESTFRPYGSTGAIHGYTSTQSVFYNTKGEAYPAGKNYIIESKQFGMGYVIGTSGPASNVLVDPVQGTMNGYAYNTSPRDFTEGIGIGQYLVPASLYLDQLEKRIKDTLSTEGYQVKVIVKNPETNAVLPGCQIRIFNDTLVTDNSGTVTFHHVPEFFVINIEKPYSSSLVNETHRISGDTVMTFYISREKFAVTIKLVNANTMSPLYNTNVTIGTVNQLTNTNGETSFQVYGGAVNYSVIKTNFQQLQGVFYIESDTLLLLTLVQTHANMRIRLRQGTTPVDQASVIANNDTLVSNGLGDAVFSQLPVNVEYAYEVKKNGYLEKSGTVYLTKDTIVTVPMTLAVYNPKTMAEIGIHFWPNPADNLINIQVPEDFVVHSWQITDLRGTRLLQGEQLEAQSINISSLVQGTYLLHIRSNIPCTIIFVKE